MSMDSWKHKYVITIRIMILMLLPALTTMPAVVPVVPEITGIGEQRNINPKSNDSIKGKNPPVQSSVQSPESLPSYPFLTSPFRSQYIIASNSDTRYHECPVFAQYHTRNFKDQTKEQYNMFLLQKIIEFRNEQKEKTADEILDMPKHVVTPARNKCEKQLLWERAVGQASAILSVAEIEEIKKTLKDMKPEIYSPYCMFVFLDLLDDIQSRLSTPTYETAKKSLNEVTAILGDMAKTYVNSEIQRLDEVLNLDVLRKEEHKILKEALSLKKRLESLKRNILGLFPDREPNDSIEQDYMIVNREGYIPVLNVMAQRDKHSQADKEMKRVYLQQSLRAGIEGCIMSLSRMYKKKLKTTSAILELAKTLSAQKIKEEIEKSKILEEKLSRIYVQLCYHGGNPDTDTTTSWCNLKKAKTKIYWFLQTYWKTRENQEKCELHNNYSLRAILLIDLIIGKDIYKPTPFSSLTSSLSDISPSSPLSTSRPGSPTSPIRTNRPGSPTGTPTGSPSENPFKTQTSNDSSSSQDQPEPRRRTQSTMSNSSTTNTFNFRTRVRRTSKSVIYPILPPRIQATVNGIKYSIPNDETTWIPMYRLAASILMAKKIHKFSTTLVKLNEEADTFIKKQLEGHLLSPHQDQDKDKYLCCKSFIKIPVPTEDIVMNCSKYIKKVRKRTKKLHLRCHEKDSITPILTKIFLFNKKKNSKIVEERKRILQRLSNSIEVFEKRVLSAFEEYIKEVEASDHNKEKLDVLIRLELMRVLLEAKIIMERGLSIMGHNTRSRSLGNLKVYVNQAVKKLSALVSDVDFVLGKKSRSFNKQPPEQA